MTEVTDTLQNNQVYRSMSEIINLANKLPLTSGNVIIVF